LRGTRAIKITKTLYVKDREKWRAWLEKNHARETEVWLIFYKKHTGKPSVPYDDAVEEALCFGWIDSLVHRIDDEKYCQKFTPRKPGSKWSESNLKRIDKMIKAGKMTAEGNSKFKAQSPNQNTTRIEDESIPSDVKKAIAADGTVKENFKKLPPGYVRMCMRWINTAKRPETREKRIREFIELTAKNERIGMK
jgi:uncharacterized protein YdeI (YjbR/CyaY-like superfamily)